MAQRISKRTKMVRELISEVVGLSPYEKRLIDMLKTGGASSEKKMYKYAKKRVSPIKSYHVYLSDICISEIYVRYACICTCTDNSFSSYQHFDLLIPTL